MNIQILHHSRDKVQSYFQEVEYQETENLLEVEAIVSGSQAELNATELEKYSSLKYIIHCCNGTNTIDKEYCKKKHIQIFNSPTANINATAEHTVALILAALRKVLPADKSVRTGNWERQNFMGKEINDSSIGFLGFGRIARLVLTKLSAFEPKSVYAYDPFLSQEQMDDVNPVKQIKVQKAELNELLAQSTIISLHLPLLPETKHMITEEQFQLMQKDTLVINCSRGGIIDEEALCVALKEHKIAGAALDVFEGEPQVNPKLFELENCILTPHIASMSDKAQTRMILEAKEAFEAHLQQYQKQ